MITEVTATDSIKYCLSKGLTHAVDTVSNAEHEALQFGTGVVYDSSINALVVSVKHPSKHVRFFVEKKVKGYSHS